MKAGSGADRSCLGRRKIEERLHEFDRRGLRQGDGGQDDCGGAACTKNFPASGRAARKRSLSGMPAPFLALAKNRNFLDRDGELSLDAGPVVEGLEYASGRTAAVLGKPAPMFFKTAVDALGCPLENAVMIGDEGRCWRSNRRGSCRSSGEDREVPPGSRAALARPAGLDCRKPEGGG
jgi:hypothetical protein